MPMCSIRPVFVETDIAGNGEVIQHVYIVYDNYDIVPKKEVDEIHAWVEKNFPDNETLSFGKHYIMKDAEGFEIAFKLTWS